MKKWNEKYPDKPWNSNSNSGTFLITKVATKIQNTRKFKEYKTFLQNGDEEYWTTNMLSYVMLDCGLKLFQELKINCTERPKDQEIQKSKYQEIRKHIKLIKGFRSSLFDDAVHMSCKPEKLAKLILHIKQAVLDMFEKDAEIEIDGIKTLENLPEDNITVVSKGKAVYKR